MSTEIVCEQCGDIGRRKDLIYCSDCSLAARHTYCMDLYPFPKDQIAPWLCQECHSFNVRRPPARINKPHHAAEPLLRSAWSGSFDVLYDDYSASSALSGMHAFLSSKACRKVRDMASNDLCPVLSLEMLTRSFVWPKDFRPGQGPTDGNIAVYFVPSMEHESAYDHMLFEMIEGDLAMRACVGEAELLVFPSTVLPSESSRFQGKLYMWGVFKGET